MQEDKSPVRLTSQQKTGFVLLLIFGLLVVGLAFLQMRHNIYVPVLEQRIAARQNFQVPELLIDEQFRLQQIDTDQDGINDYEELTFFKTSPYLPDTDSDGISDKDEIDQGTDPLCPEGQDCDLASGSPVNSTSTPISPLFENSPTVEDIYGGAIIDSGLLDNPVDTGVDIAAAIRNPAEIRKLLLETGQIPKETLDQIDDQTLLQLAEQIYAEQQAGSQ